MVAAASVAGLDVAIEVLSEVDSTQTRLLSQPPGSTRPWRVCVAHHQTQGRGRLDRSWESQPGDGLMFSVAFRPEPVALAPISAGVAVARAVARFLPDVKLKWPNDLVTVGDGALGKLGGIVATTHPEDHTLVVLGVGINCFFSRERPTPQAAALADYLEVVPTREELLIAILRELGRVETTTETEILDAYRPICQTLGTNVRLTTIAGAEVTGIASAVGAQGLEITGGDGSKGVFGSGDVEHLRNS